MSLTSSYYPYLEKGSSLESFKTVSTGSYLDAQYTERLTGSYPFSSSVDVSYYSFSSSFSTERRKIYALKNILNSYKYYSEHYAFSSSYGNKYSQPIKIINIPSVMIGSSIDRGSVELGFYVSGSLLAKLEDINKNGELIQTTGSNGYKNVAGVVLYNEGIILLTGSWNLENSFTEKYVYSPTSIIDNPKWIYWGAGLNESSNLTVSSSFSLNYESNNYVNVLTMLAHADKGDFNYSNNPTYIDYESANNTYIITSSYSYLENNKKNIKNTIKYNYDNYTGSLEKQTYISKIAIYDENKNLIGVAKVSKPVRKPENRDLTFKLKLDI